MTGCIVAVKMADDWSYTVPALVVEDNGITLRVRFSAGNERVINRSLIVPATMADIEEFESVRTPELSVPPL